MIDALKTLGIEKGKPFAPDAQTTEVLNGAAEEARAWLDVQYEESLDLPFYESGHWALPAQPEMLKGMQSYYADPDSYPVDGRAVTYAMAFFCPKRPAAGSFYLMTTKDKDGRPFDGSATYRLTVPPGVPVRQYWSATAYDRETHGLVRNVDRASRSSQNPELQVNSNEAIDVFFAPAAPAGKDSNWVPTDPKRGFEVLFRFYGPEKSLFEKRWVLPDVERIG